MTVNFVAAIRNDFARVEQIVRVKGVLDLPHELIKLFADMFLEVLGAGDADAVFAGQRALEL